ncbi:hypothetical protein A3A20_00330 [Candidatus Wolfebacteria bacterium RIFCSPLOWO2_01_FULL_45_19]|uniref:Glycosyl transferase family 1 domain-containing protein n=1 Tax=Candidatus Wolfebacteria bacterium RIFCSPLOWO2_01_FULL_45_19 TaxID=1802557 RepID=A0A1F8DQV9_9BACT|nr:MAG: Glycosyltransferase [Parcubacteria group bacterium GW2011_GWB1_45_9]OGM91013.1 MAG: hypothetical protein A3A20_00330 [Candidatus Wolfebacteria bacterium RIFCSPLOWO2_01_FULL_45_19]
MKICFLAGADSVHSYKWVKFFAEKGHEIHWISFTPNTQGEIPGVHFYKIDKPFPLGFFALNKIVRSIKPNIFHAHYAGKNGLLAALANFHPFILTAWGSDVLLAGKSKLKKPFVKYALKKADLITCDAEHMKKAIIELGVEPEKIKIIYFGIDTKKFQPAKSYKLKAKSYEVISLRSLEPVYDVETLVRAAPLVLRQIPEANFIIAGRGSEEEKLKKLASELGVLRNMEFIGFVKQNDLPCLLQSADIYVSTSLSDAGIAASTAEAMACGLPVVITNTGENELWVKNGAGGFIVPVKTPKILAEKIIELLKNPQTRRQFGETNRKTIEEKNDYYTEMAKAERSYYDLKTPF